MSELLEQAKARDSIYVMVYTPNGDEVKVCVPLTKQDTQDSIMKRMVSKMCYELERCNYFPRIAPGTFYDRGTE